MPKITETHLKRVLFDHFPDMPESRVRQLARKFKRIADSCEEDFYDQLRVLGIFADPTAWDTARRIT